MTAEIAILNKTAVALAADSKVTLSVGGKRKTYDTVDKVFSLSKTEPVGAMIYGSAEFMGFPWETILKQYRHDRPAKQFGTVFDWSDDLLAYLSSFYRFSQGDQAEAVVISAGSVVDGVVSRVVADSDPGLDTAELEEIIGENIDDAIAALEPLDSYYGEDWPTVHLQLADAFQSAANAGAAAYFPGCAAKFTRLAQLLTEKHAVSGSASSGLVVAGFGQDELLPSLISFEIDGFIGGRLKLVETKRFDTTRKSQGAIIPFAQSDMVFRFMEGIDPIYSAELFGTVERLLVQHAADAAEALGVAKAVVTAARPALEKATADAVKAFHESMQQRQRELFAEPIIQMAMRLPKDELAHLAESLVSLTSLQRRVSDEIETVGGAIDVAVISKGDGLVWIKRKHYFDPDRNLRFVNGYFHDYAARREE